jgi:eukaryotic-like serine/threonine-protein kinase
MAEADNDPLVGKVLNGRFQIMSPIGKGGMGRVYKALQTPLDRFVALKVLNPRYDSSKDPGFERRFFLEASMTAKLKHPNTITVHDYGRTDDGIFFIAMEFVEGETLQAVLKAEHRLSWPRALAVAGQVARSLREAHKAGLVHRDLKPANIMLVNEGTGGDVVKVLDFGLVKTFAPDAKPQDTEITQAGMLLGSPLYMAPEQARAEADPRTDIYSLGVVLFQMIAGRPPFEGKESIDIIVKQIREKPPALREFAADVPFEVVAIVEKCMEKRPDDRFESMEALLEAMRAATAGQGLSGLFMDPRTLSGTAWPRPSVGGGVHVASPVQNEVLPHSATQATPEIDVSLEPSRVESSPRRLGLLALGALIVTGVAIGAFVASSALNKPTVTPTSPVAPPEVTRPTAPPNTAPSTTPVMVNFTVSSSPLGATVTRDGAILGVTPLQLSVPKPEGASAMLTVQLSLDGYASTTLSAQGVGGEVPVSHAFKRLPKPTPPPTAPKRPTQKKPEKPDGYKEDPY